MIRTGRVIAVLFAISVVSTLAFTAIADTKGDAKKGKSLYAEAGCSACHGKTGKGDGPMAKSLDPKPTNFTDAKYMKTRTDKQLFKATKDGGPAVGKAASMPAYGDTYKDDQIWDLVRYIRTFARPKK